MPSISVIITSYNQRTLLREAVDSALAQTLKPAEIIICDDHSADDSRQLIEAYAQKYPEMIRPIFQQTNLGVSANRNSGLRLVSSDYVTWLDGDDYLANNKLEHELDAVARSDSVEWAYSQVYMVNDQGTVFGTRFSSMPSGMIFDELPTKLGRAPRTLFVQRQALEKTGFFDETMTLYEDFDLCLRLAKFHKCAYCDLPLSYYRVHSEGLHKSNYSAHMRNLSILTTHLNELLSDYTEPKRQRLLAQFADRADYLIMKKISVDGDCKNTWEHAKRLMRRSAKHVFARELYACLIRAWRSKTQKKARDGIHQGTG